MALATPARSGVNALVSLAAAGGLDLTPRLPTLAATITGTGAPGRTRLEPLAYGQLLGFNEPWEATWLEESVEYLSNSEGCGWTLRADPDTSALYETLWAFAIGQGLLIGACQADAAAQGVAL